MRAAITRAPGGPISVEDIAEPEKRSGSVLVDLDLGLLTGSDWATYTNGGDALFPLVQGTSGVGTLASGGGSLIVGSRVVIWPQVACGRCALCAAGWRDECVDPTVLGRDRAGTLAERVLVPRDNAVLAPSVLSAEAAGAAVDYADGWRLLGQAGSRDGDRRVAIIGSGGTAAATRRLAASLTAEVAGRETAAGLAEDDRFDAIVAIGSAVTGLVDHLAVGGVMVVRDASPSDIDAATLAERRARVVGAGPSGRQDFVEVLRWMADEEFVPPVGAAVPLDEVGEALDDRAEITDPVPVLLS